LAAESGLVGGTWALLGLGIPASGTRKGNDAIATPDTDRKPTAFLGLVFRSLAQNRANVRAVAHIVHLSDPVAGASVTVPSRRTPSISAISSRVMVSSFEGKHSRLGTAGGAAAGRYPAMYASRQTAKEILRNLEPSEPASKTCNVCNAILAKRSVNRHDLPIQRSQAHHIQQEV